MKRPAFRRFMTGLIFYLAGLYLPQALFSIYLVKILRAADDQIGLAATLGSLAATVSYPIWGRYMTQQRLRLLLALSCIGWGIFPALVSLTPNMTVYVFVAIYANLFGSGVTTSIVQVLMGIGPSTERPTRVAIYNTLVGGAGVLLPTLGTALLRIIDIHIVLLIAATLRIFAGIIFATIPQWQADKA
jgi:MFS family permease